MATLHRNPALLSLAALTLLGATQVAAQNVMTIDATAPMSAPQPVQAKLGTAQNPQGQVLGANSQYLTLDGKPWLPVMGEFHFSRYPEAEWEPEILKMKAAGVQIISTYVIWIHHEQNEGVFDWQGQRDLRRFVQLCAKHGMYVFPRIGPWSHAEVRNGGFPDWVLKNGPVRENDPVYLKEVQTYFAAIAAQLHGLIWKDGGPVIGIQIENEYHGSGPGKGNEHIRTLKQMAIADGLDVPLYTVTGWDGVPIPLDAALPVFGGYPDAPWDGLPTAEPPNEVFAFRFDNRSAGSMGMIGGRGQSNASAYAGTPFLTAEVGDGIEDTYFRRPVVSTDDVAAIVPVMLGSGVNMMGYYMFHGGRNPDAGPPDTGLALQESQRTGDATDTPLKSYDFQAPLGEYGQERESLRRLKLVHYFLNDFGVSLAPMLPHPPHRTPHDPADNSVPRVSARTSCDSGYLFFSNHVRGLAMPARPGFQIELHLPTQTVRVPATPITLPSDVYGIWPVNLPVGGATLRYSTAQLFKHVDSHGDTYYFFFAVPGIAPEFLLDATTHVVSASANVARTITPAGLRLRTSAAPSTEITLAGGTHLVLLSQSVAETVWQTDDPSLLLATADAAFADGSTWTIQSTGDPSPDPEVHFGIFGTASAPTADDVKLRAAAGPAVFHNYAVSLPPVKLPVVVTKVQSAGPPPPVELGPEVSWRPHALAMAPALDAYKTAAIWKIELPAVPAGPFVSDAFLHIDYQGDAAQVLRKTHIVDDNFWNGVPWTLGMKELAPQDESNWRGPQALELRVLPLPRNFPMYIEDASRLHFNADGVADTLTGVELLPQYQLVLHAPGH